MSKQFYFKQFSLAKEQSLVLFDPYLGPTQLQPLRARVDRGSMAIKGYSTFPRFPALLEPHHHILVTYPGHSLVVGGYLSAQMQSMGKKTSAKTSQFILQSIYKHYMLIITDIHGPFHQSSWGIPRGIVGNVLEEFELQLRYYVHFRTNILWKHESSYNSTVS